MGAHSHSHSGTDHHHGTGTYFVVFAALMVLLALTVWLAFIQLGPLNLPIAMLVASVKAALVIWYFMHVKDASPLVLASIVAGFVTLGIGFLFVFADYFMR